MDNLKEYIIDLLEGQGVRYKKNIKSAEYKNGVLNLNIEFKNSKPPFYSELIKTICKENLKPYFKQVNITINFITK